MATTIPQPEAAPVTPRPGRRRRTPSGSTAPFPHLAEGLEFCGEFEDSGYREAPWIIRRADGQMLQLPKLLYRVAEAIEHSSSWEELQRTLSDEEGARIDVEDLRFIVDRKLVPLGVIALANGAEQQLGTIDPMLALKYRFTLVPASVVRRVASALRFLYAKPIVIAVVLTLIAVDVWVFGIHGVAPGVRSALYQPAFMLVVLGSVIASALFHEFGHAAACRAGGATPGRIGGGLYLVWPAFYCDVTDAYRLDRGGRIRTDCGGIYFNAIFSIATFGAYLATGWEPLLLVIVLQHLEMLHQLMPFLRLDGYLILSDITGVPDMFTRIGPVLRSMIPGRSAGEKVTALKPWVRVAVTAWVLLLIPAMLYVFAMLLLAVPRVFGTARDSAGGFWDKAGASFAAGDTLSGAWESTQLLLVVLPVLTTSVLIGRAALTAARGAWRVSDGRPVLRSAIGLVCVAAVAWAVVSLWPEGDRYRPIQEGERGRLTAQPVSVLRESRAAVPVADEPAEAAEEETEAADEEQPDEATPEGDEGTETVAPEAETTDPTTTDPATGEVVTTDPDATTTTTTDPTATSTDPTTTTEPTP